MNGGEAVTSEEVKTAMLNFTPVLYDGIVYDRITAYIYRVIELHKRGHYKAVLQVELLDKSKNSVTIVDAHKVELLKGESK